jgi:hypothetical protein
VEVGEFEILVIRGQHHNGTAVQAAVEAEQVGILVSGILPLQTHHKEIMVGIQALAVAVAVVAQVK